MNDDFGIVIGCYKGDYRWAKACIASIRHFIGDVPICLLVDGDIDVEDMKRTYGVQVLYQKQLKNEYLRKHCKGFGLPKLTLLWESPFEYFLFLDGDTITWGDVLPKIKGDGDWDFVTDFVAESEPKTMAAGPEGIPDETIDIFFFDVKKVQEKWPEFDFRKYNLHYYCTGAWAARRNCIPFEEFRELFDFHLANPGVFKFGEMGLLNFMIFKIADAGRLKVRSVHFQLETYRTGLDELIKVYEKIDDNVAVPPEEAYICHFTWFKPLYYYRHYSRAMNYFRREVFYRTKNRSRLAATASLLFEDVSSISWKWYVKFLLGRVKRNPVR